MTSIVTSTFNPRSYIYSSNSETLILQSATPESRLSLINSSYPTGNFRYVLSASSNLLTISSILDLEKTNIQTFSTVGGIPYVETFGSSISSNISFSASSSNSAKLIIFKDDNPSSSTQFSGIGLNYSSNAVEYYASGAPYTILRHNFYAGTSANTSVQLMTMQLNSLSGIPQAGIGIAPEALGPTTSLSLANDLKIAGSLVIQNITFDPTTFVTLDPLTHRLSCNVMPYGVVFTSGNCNLIDQSLLPVNFSGSYFKTYKNFGIGTRTPVQRLQVQGNTYITDRLGVGVAYPESRLHIIESSAVIPTATLYNTIGGDVLRTYISNNTLDGHVNLPVLTIVGTHQGVGIGTLYVDPSNALEVVGNTSTTSLISSNIYINGNELLIPAGSTYNRPLYSKAGMIRYNTDTSAFEGCYADNIWGSFGSSVTNFIFITTSNLTVINNATLQELNVNTLINTHDLIVNNELDAHTTTTSNLTVINNATLQELNVNTLINTHDLIVNNELDAHTITTNELHVSNTTTTNDLNVSNTITTNDLHVSNTITTYDISATNIVTTHLLASNLDVTDTIDATNIVTTHLLASNLDVTDTIDATNIVTTHLLASNLDVSDSIHANEIYANEIYGHVNTPSDIRIKYSITRMINSLLKVNNINGYTYSLTNEIHTPKQNIRHAGVVAQEIEKILPEAVSCSTNGILSVNYNSIIPLLIESIKELTTKVGQLELLLNTHTNILNNITNMNTNMNSDNMDTT